MNIIIEGPDGGGKSTLASVIASILDWPVIHSTGPSSSDEAFNEKAQAFLTRNETIFDRHCIVSEHIYGLLLRNRVMTFPQSERLFYQLSNLFIYVPGDPELKFHTKKPHDTLAHILQIEQQHRNICYSYDAWALRHAHIIYRKGEPPHRVVRFIKGELRR